ncbi:MAG: hypothetical protein ABL958_21515 [Bdellovibrionia bacterium]
MTARFPFFRKFFSLIALAVAGFLVFWFSFNYFDKEDPEGKSFALYGLMVLIPLALATAHEALVRLTCAYEISDGIIRRTSRLAFFRKEFPLERAVRFDGAADLPRLGLTIESREREKFYIPGIVLVANTLFNRKLYKILGTIPHKPKATGFRSLFSRFGRWEKKRHDKFVTLFGVICGPMLIIASIHEAVLPNFVPMKRIEATVTKRTKYDVIVQYERDGQIIKNKLDRGIFRFRYPKKGEKWAMYYNPTDPNSAVSDPPYGDWFGWILGMAIWVLVTVVGAARLLGIF